MSSQASQTAVRVKSPLTYAEQEDKIKSKGFLVEDADGCARFLKQANYYRLSAYFLPFKKPDGTYEAAINFNRIKRIYEFDSAPRGLIFRVIEKIEFYTRTTLAYYRYFRGLSGELA